MLSIWMCIFQFFETEDLVGIGAHPRLHVYGTFNLWRSYCKVGWRSARQLRSFEVFALIIYHVRLIDDYVDDELRPRGIPVESKNLKAGSRRLISLLRKKISDLPIADEAKSTLVKTLQDYRRTVAAAFVVEGREGHDALIEAVLQQRWDITATVYITIIRTLNLIHGIDPVASRNIEDIFANWSIALQVSDDILDFNVDVDSIQNIAVSIARKFPDEMTRWLSRGRVTRGWAKRCSPSILGGIDEVWEHYAQAMIKTDSDHPVVRVMVIISAVIKRSVLSRFPQWLYKY
jgi:hypothetical protein